MLIDIHTHIFPDKIATNAIKSLAAKSKIVPFTDGTLSDTINKFKIIGVDKFVVQNIAVNIKQEENVNNFAISINKANVISFGSVHPYSNCAIDTLKKLKDNGIVGVKFHNEYQNFDIDDINAIKIYEECIKLNFVIMFHGGKDVAFDTPLKASPKKFKNLYDVLPYDKYIFAHMGGFECYDEAMKYLKDTKINIDTSFCLTKMSDEKAKEVIQCFGSNRILFGSDCPWDNPQFVLDKLKNLNLTQDEFNDITYKNAIKLLNI